MYASDWVTPEQDERMQLFGLVVVMSSQIARFQKAKNNIIKRAIMHTITIALHTVLIIMYWESFVTFLCVWNTHTRQNRQDMHFIAYIICETCIPMDLFPRSLILFQTVLTHAENSKNSSYEKMENTLFIVINHNNYVHLSMKKCLGRYDS